MNEQCEEQKAFETWAEERQMNLALDCTGAYWHGITFAAWLGWQAALKWREKNK